MAQISAIATEREAEKSSWRVERVTHPCVESTYLFSLLQPGLSAPGLHTRGASHPIITLKWLLPHRWRMGGWPRSSEAACLTRPVTFPKLTLSAVCCCGATSVQLLWLYLHICSEMYISGQDIASLLLALKRCLVVRLKKRKNYDGIWCHKQQQNTVCHLDASERNKYTKQSTDVLSVPGSSWMEWGALTDQE